MNVDFNTDLFGEPIKNSENLRAMFIEPPFSILNSKGGEWQKRKLTWKHIGIKSEVGRKSSGNNTFEDLKTNVRKAESTKKIASIGGQSIFDPVLCELIYNWFCCDGGKILDPFAGGSVRGIVAHKLGYKYTGIDIRQEQIESNREQAKDILDINNLPNWYIGDSSKILDDNWTSEFDFLFSCPPYSNLEVYSNLDGDISNMGYADFLYSYEQIIFKACKLLKVGSYACFVVGEVRDKKGNYIGFVPDTINAFKKAGMKYYNEAIYLNMIGSASLRATTLMRNKKLVKVHQNVLIFRK